MKVNRSDDRIWIMVGDLTISHLLGGCHGDSPEIVISNSSDGTMVGSHTETCLDVSKLDEYIEGLTALKAELVAASPRSAKDYVEERELGGDPWREGRMKNGER